MTKFDFFLLFSFALVGVAPLAAEADEPAAVTPQHQLIDQQLARSVVDRIVVDVERLRGLSFKQTVPVDVVDDDRAMEQNLARLEEFGALEDLRWMEDVLKLLGLAHPDDDVMQLVTEALREQIGGYYDPSTEQFYLLDDMPAAMVDILTAHELTHALEDQYFELDALLMDKGVDDDRIFARGSVTEGSATLLMTIYSVEKAFGQQFTEDEIAAMTNVGEEAMNKLPRALLRQMMAPYLLGLSFVQRGNPSGWMAGGFPSEQIDAVYGDPPVSSEQILHPETYWNEPRDNPVEVHLGGAGRALGAGWTRVYDGVLGEINLGLLVGARTPDPTDPAAMVGSSWTNEAASGWGGDRFELWKRGNRSALLVLTVWDSERDAQQFSDALDWFPRAERSDGVAVALLYGDVKRKRVDAVLDAMLGQAPAP